MTDLKHVWLDCDPGHDDATAILLALHSPNIRLLGISTVHGNAGADNTQRNAARCLHAFHAAPEIKTFPGATKPLIRSARADPEIHGADGLGGVQGLPDFEHPDVRTRIARFTEDTDPIRALEGMSDAIQELWKERGIKTVVVSTGPMTNIALFVSVYPDILPAVEEFVFMGGGIGLGNRSAVAEYNILCDPEAAQIVLDAPVKKTMIPLNVTHTAILTRALHAQLLTGTRTPPEPALASPHEPATLPAPATPLRHTLSTLISFFAAAYASTFNFTAGPPLHDALTLAYVSHPQLFACRRYRVDVELGTGHSVGQTVADVWGYRDAELDLSEDAWGREGRNCLVAESMDVAGFFDYFLDCVDRCDAVSPLNAKV